MCWCAYWVPSAAAQYGGMKGERQLKIRIRRILFPILFCLAVACLIELPLAQTALFGDDVILLGYTCSGRSWRFRCWYILYREDSVFRGKEHWNGKIAAAAFFGGAGIILGIRPCGESTSDPWRGVLADESLFTGNLLAGGCGASGGIPCSWRNTFSAAFSMEDARSLCPPRRQHS